MTDKAKKLVKSRYSFEDMTEIMALLRSEDGCPWDREQTHDTIRKNFIEETYEAVEAIDKRDYANLREELGDVLLQVLFHTQMEAEAGRFTIDDVITEVCTKLVVRHPHIFGDVSADSAEKVLENWEDIKIRTKGQTSAKDRLEDVPKSLPALMRAYKVVSRAEKAGCVFDADETFNELELLLGKLKKPEKGSDMEEMIGKFLLKTVILSKKTKIEPEEALTKATERYIIYFKEGTDCTADKPL